MASDTKTLSESGKSALFPATPYARVVPNGLEQVDGRTVLRATVLVTPDPIKSSSMTSEERSNWPLYLASWPADLLRCIFNGASCTDAAGNEKPMPYTIGLTMRPTTPTQRASTNHQACSLEEATTCAEQLSIAATATKLKRVYAQSIADTKDQPLDPVLLRQLQAFWGSTFITEETGWADLHSVLLRSSEGTSFRAADNLVDPDSPDPTQLKSNRGTLDNDDQSPTLPTIDEDGYMAVDPEGSDQHEVSGIYTQNHADMTLALEFDRVNRVLEGLKNPPLDAPFDALVFPESTTELTQAKTTEPAAVVDSVNGTGPKAATDEERVLRDKEKLHAEMRAHLTKRRGDHLKKLKGNRADGSNAYRKARPGTVCEVRVDPCSTRLSAKEILTDAVKRGRCIEQGKYIHDYSTPRMKLADGTAKAQDTQNSTLRAALESSQAASQATSQAANLALQKTSQRYFAIQSTGVLSRLYMTAIDVEYTLDDVEAACISQWLMQSEGKCFIYISVSDQFGCTLAQGPDRYAPWTLSKFTSRTENLPGAQSSQVISGAASGDFWPVTFEEQCHAQTADAACEAIETLTQMDGYRIAGECWHKPDEAPTPRFDLTSLDMRNATEQGIQTDSETTASAKTKQANPYGAFHTAGLAILDRGMQAEKALLLARRERLKESARQVPVIDALDLTVGYRLDVAVPDLSNMDDQSASLWRQMHVRLVDYGYGSSGNAAEFANTVLGKGLVGRMSNVDRISIDAAMVTAPEQLLPKTDDFAVVDLCVAENVVTWQGAPLGVETLKPVVGIDDKTGAQPIEPSVEDTLPFGRKISLPTLRNLRSLPGAEANYYLPPALRFGWPYKFAFRATFSGGTSVKFGSIDQVQDCYDHRLAFPSIYLNADVKRSAFFRFLRQKPVDAPVILMPLNEALQEHGDMGYQESLQVVVRSVEARATQALDQLSKREQEQMLKRATPARTSRIIMPPSMAMDDVARHGVLDRQKVSTPVGAFLNVRWDKVRGQNGFPVLETESVLGFNNVYVPTRKRRSEHVRSFEAAKSVGQVKVEKRNRRTLTYSQALYIKSETQRDYHYYPDPFAQTLVIGLRRRGWASYLPGPPITVDIYRQGASTDKRPDIRQALPVVVTFEAEKIRTNTVGPDQLVTTTALAGKPRFVVLNSQGKVTAESRESLAHAIEIVISIPAGWELEADCWFVPSVSALASQSALLQGIATLAVVHSSLQASSGIDDKCRDGLKQLNMDELLLAGRSSWNVDNTPASRGYDLCGPGGVEVPSDALLLEIADGLLTRLLNQPMAEVSAINTLHCTHASDRFSSAITASAITFHRASVEGYRQWLVDTCQGDELTDAENTSVIEKASSDTLIVEDEPFVLLTGRLKLDLGLVSGFDIMVRAENPTTATFDDMARRRDLSAIRAGTWPVVRNAEGAAYLKTTSQLYGFDVNEAGKVTLPESDILLFKVRGLPLRIRDGAATPEGEPGTSDSRTELSLFDLLYEVEGRQGRYGGASVESTHTLAGCVGRNTQIIFRAIPRTLQKLATADSLEFSLRESLGKHKVSKPFVLSVITFGAGELRVQAPPSVRPAQPALRGPLYCFKWMSDGRQKESSQPFLRSDSHQVIMRKPVVRIPVDRSWFSSGADEKLGIVMWPPNLLSQDNLSADIRDDSVDNWKVNSIEYRVSRADATVRNMKIDEFMDDDLGPGGQFVTRVGADPTKAERASARLFLDHTAFNPDVFIEGRLGKYDADWRTELKPQHIIEHALMPVSGLGTKDETDTQENNKQVQYMSVALMLYEPKFDPENEQWYVDIELTNASAFSEPFIRFGVVRYAPHGREDLRVSQPSVIWAKLLPQREVSVGYKAPRGDSNTAFMEVKVAGASAPTSLMTGGRDASEFAADAVKDLTSPERPKMHMVVVRESALQVDRSSDNAGVITREHLALSLNDEQLAHVHDDMENDSGPKLNRVRNDRDEHWFTLEHVNGGIHGYYWQAIVKLDLVSDLKQGEQIVLYLEEVEQYRPASYDDEPVQLSRFNKPDTWQQLEQDYLVESGPRFSSRVVVAKG